MIGIPMPILIRMILNIGVDSIIGSIPFFGDLADFFLKSNQRNRKLIENYLEFPQKTKRRSTVWLFFFMSILISFFSILLYLGRSLYDMVIKAM